MELEMKKFFLIFIICTMTVPTFAADRYYANAADEARGKAEYYRLQQEINKIAKKDQERRKQLNARPGAIVLTNEEIKQRTDLLGRYITHPESRKAIDFVNNAKVDDYKRTEFDEMKVDTSHTTFDNKEQGPAKMQYKFGNGGN